MSDAMFRRMQQTRIHNLEQELKKYEQAFEIQKREYFDLKKEYDDLQNELAKYRWVSVLDENPEYDKQVLMYDKDNGYRVVTFEYDDTQNCNTKIFINGENYYESIGYVLMKDSCWTSLPFPPKENNNE